MTLPKKTETLLKGWILCPAVRTTSVFYHFIWGILALAAVAVAVAAAAAT